jgi:mersacidin/lichenicidin family type 2 lantibiotic
MAAKEVIKAWKDEDYREKLTAVQKAQLPEHPAGRIEFEQPELEDEGPLRAGPTKYTHACSHGCYTKKRTGC